MIPKIATPVFALVLAVLLVHAAEATQKKNRSVEWMLASIHLFREGDRSYKKPNAALVRKFRRLLNRLKAECPETQKQLSDMGVAAHNDLREAKKPETLLDVFTNWNTAIPDEWDSASPCIEVLAAYLTLRGRELVGPNAQELCRSDC